MSIYGGPDIVTDGLVLHLDAANRKSYPGSGSTWYDLSGNGNNGTLSYPTYTNTNYGSFNFDYINDYVYCGQVLNNVAYTKMAWFRPEGTSANIISGGGESTHAFWMGGTTTTLSSGHNSSWNLVSYRPNNPGDMLNKWWFGATTFSSSIGHRLYLNGIQVSSSSNTTTVNGNGTVRIGSYGDAGNLFDGDIPMVLIYNRFLSANEVQQNYNALKGRYGL